MGSSFTFSPTAVSVGARADDRGGLGVGVSGGAERDGRPRRFDAVGSDCR